MDMWWRFAVGALLGLLITLAVDVFITSPINNHNDMLKFPVNIHIGASYYNFLEREGFKDAINLPNVGNALNEHQLLLSSVRLLCFAIEDNLGRNYIEAVLDTWAKDCNRVVVLFMTEQLFMDFTAPKAVTSKWNNVHMALLARDKDVHSQLLLVLSQFSTNIAWFVFVPSQVFLIAGNLRLLLKSNDYDHNMTVFIGETFGHYSFGKSAPVVISFGALRKLQTSTKIAECRKVAVTDISCFTSMVESTVVDLHDKNGHSLAYSIDFYPNKKIGENFERTPVNFPVAIHVKGSFENFYELQWYIYHLKAYGTPHLGSKRKLINSTSVQSTA